MTLTEQLGSKAKKKTEYFKTMGELFTKNCAINWYKRPGTIQDIYKAKIDKTYQPSPVPYKFNQEEKAVNQTVIKLKKIADREKVYVDSLSGNLKKGFKYDLN